MKRRKNRVLRALIILFLILLLLAVLLISAAAVFSRKSSSSFDQLIGEVIHKSPGSTGKKIKKSDSVYYYQKLDEEGKTIYSALCGGIEAGQDEIEVPGADLKKIENVWTCVLSDHPEYFWLNGATKIVSHEPVIGDDYSTVRPARYCDKEEQKERSAQIDAAVQAYLSQIPEDADDYERIRRTYEYIIETTDYDVNASDNQSIYSVFARRRSVCAGYAKAFQYLMKVQGIDCIYVTGRITETGESHGWNIVKCNDHWYQVDVTWGDPVYNVASDELPASLRSLNYDYLCCTDDLILKTHKISRKYKVPGCSYDDLNYYKLEGMYYDYYDTDAFRSIIFDEVDHRKDRTVFVFASQELYDQAHKELTGSLIREGANRILQNTGMGKVRTYYEEEPSMYKVVVYWQYQ